MMRNNTVVVIATYNEADNIRELLDGLTDYPVIVVDDSSPDGTGQIAAGYPNVRVITRPGKQGVASAYIQGLWCVLENYDPVYVVQMDAGLTHDPADVTWLVKTAKDTGANLVIGCRFALRVKLRSYRTLISLFAAWLMRRIGVNVYDATSGFRCWKANLLERVLNGYEYKSMGFAFQLETLYRAVLMGARIMQCSIEYRLTNSTFKPSMLWEALRVYAGLWLDYRRRKR